MTQFCIWVWDPEDGLGPGPFCFLSGGVSVLLGPWHTVGALSAEVPSLDRPKNCSNEDDVPSLF